MQRFRICWLVAAMFLLAVVAAQAGYICSETRYTPVRQGNGGTCSAAQGSASSAAWTDVYLDCYYWNFYLGHCDAEFILTDECSGQPGCHSASGYYAYSCVICDPEDPCEY
jgi:hypothetical protein